MPAGRPSRQWMIATALLAIVFALLVSTGSSSEAIECPYIVVGSVEVYFVSFYEHEDPNNPGFRFTMDSPIAIATDTTVSVSTDWFPVAFEWFSRPEGSPDPFELVKTCGEVPDEIYVPPPPSATDPPDCPITVTGSVEIYLVAFYIHEDKDDHGTRYTYTTETIIATDENLPVLFQGYPVAFEIFARPYGTVTKTEAEFELVKTCGEVPSPVYPFIFSNGFENGSTSEWTRTEPAL